MTELLVGLAVFAFFVIYVLVTYIPMPPLLRQAVIVTDSEGKVTA
jgi:hypothetical protein